MIKDTCDFMGRRPSRCVNILPNLVALDTLVVEIFLACHIALTYWRYINITCLITLIWVKFCRCTCLANLMTIGLIEMAISILLSVLTWTSWKELNSALLSDIFFFFLKSRIPIYNYKVTDTIDRRTARIRIQAIAKPYTFHTNANFN